MSTLICPIYKGYFKYSPALLAHFLSINLDKNKIKYILRLSNYYTI
jgi:hypothetical protein